MFLVGLCIFQVNSLIAEGYLIKNYEKQLNTLNTENKNLEIQFGKVNSLENLNTLVENLNFEKVDKVYYIKILEGQVAKENNLPSIQKSKTKVWEGGEGIEALQTNP